MKHIVVYTLIVAPLLCMQKEPVCIMQLKDRRIPLTQKELILWCSESKLMDQLYTEQASYQQIPILDISNIDHDQWQELAHLLEHKPQTISLPLLNTAAHLECTRLLEETFSTHSKKDFSNITVIPCTKTIEDSQNISQSNTLRDACHPILFGKLTPMISDSFTIPLYTNKKISDQAMYSAETHNNIRCKTCLFKKKYLSISTTDDGSLNSWYDKNTNLTYRPHSADIIALELYNYRDILALAITLHRCGKTDTIKISNALTGSIIQTLEESTLSHLQLRRGTLLARVYNAPTKSWSMVHHAAFYQWHQSSQKKIEEQKPISLDEVTTIVESTHRKMCLSTGHLITSNQPIKLTDNIVKTFFEQSNVVRKFYKPIFKGYETIEQLPSLVLTDVAFAECKDLYQFIQKQPPFAELPILNTATKLKCNKLLKKFFNKNPCTLLSTIRQHYVTPLLKKDSTFFEIIQLDHLQAVKQALPDTYSKAITPKLFKKLFMPKKYEALACYPSLQGWIQHTYDRIFHGQKILLSDVAAVTAWIQKQIVCPLTKIETDYTCRTTNNKSILNCASLFDNNDD